MSLSTTEVAELVTNNFPSATPWRDFHDALLNGEAVGVQPYGWAYLEETVRPEADSYGYVDDDYASFVFRLGAQHFRKEGYLDSYDGLRFNGDLIEVRAKAVTVSRWEAV